MTLDRGKITKIVAMLASDFENEQLNALRLLKTMAAKEGKTLPEILLAAPPAPKEVIVYRDSPVRSEPPPRSYYDGFREHSQKQERRQDRRMLLEAIEKALAEGRQHLDENEIDFCTMVPVRNAFDWQLTQAQRRMAQRIIRKVRYGNAEPLV